MNEISFKNSMQLNTVVSGSQDQKFENQSILAGKTIETIIARVGAAAGTKTSNGIEVSANLDNVYLNLVDSGNNKIHEAIPLYLLDPTRNGYGKVWPINSAKIDWTKSSLFFGDAAQAVANKGKEIPLFITFK